MGKRQSKQFSDIAPKQEGSLPPFPKRRRLRRLHRLLFGKSNTDEMWAKPTKMGRKIRKRSARLSPSNDSPPAPSPADAAPPFPIPLPLLLPVHRRPEIFIDRLPTPPALPFPPGLPIVAPPPSEPIHLPGPIVYEDEEDWDLGSPFPIPYPDPGSPRWSTPVPLPGLDDPPEVHLSDHETPEAQPMSPTCFGYPPSDIPLDTWTLEDVDSVDLELSLGCHITESVSTDGDILAQYQRDFDTAPYLMDPTPSDPTVHSLAPQEGLDKWQVKQDGKEQAECAKNKKGSAKPTKTKVKAFKKKPKGPAARAVKNLVRKVRPKRRSSEGGEVFSSGARVLNAPVAVDQQDSLPGMVL